jgi:hypothetical protein
MLAERGCVEGRSYGTIRALFPRRIARLGAMSGDSRMLGKPPRRYSTPCSAVSVRAMVMLPRLSA